jgi:hypothetical protein
LDKTDNDSFTYLGWAFECQASALVHQAWHKKLSQEAVAKLSLADLIEETHCHELLE